MLDFECGASASELGRNRRSPNWHGRRQDWILNFGCWIGREDEAAPSWLFVSVFLSEDKGEIGRNRGDCWIYGLEESCARPSGKANIEH